MKFCHVAILYFSLAPCAVVLCKLWILYLLYIFVNINLFFSMFKTLLSISYRTRLVVTKSPSICLSRENFNSPSFMKFIKKIQTSGWQCFSLSTLWRYHLVHFWPARFLLESLLLVWRNFLYRWLDTLLLLILKYFHFYFRHSEYNMPWLSPLCNVFSWGSLGLLYLDVWLSW